jgi:hypothetical protein
MACECSESDVFPVWTGQRIFLGRAILSSLVELRYEVGDGLVPVAVAYLDQERVEEQ